VYEGLRALVSYQEESSAGNQDIFVSTLNVDDWYYPTLVESHLYAGYSAVDDLTPSICSKHSSGSWSRDCMTVWHRVAGMGLSSAINGLLHYSP
jgi:hypothetical protein